MNATFIISALVSGLIFGAVCAGMAVLRQDRAGFAFMQGLILGPLGLLIGIFLNIRSSISAAKISGFFALAVSAMLIWLLINSNSL